MTPGMWDRDLLDADPPEAPPDGLLAGDEARAVTSDAVPRQPVGTRYDLVESPLGELLLTADGAALTGLYMSPHKGGPDFETSWRRVRMPAVREQLAAYFAGELTTFDLQLAPSGTPFQRVVWAGLRDIPYGRTESYGQLAARIGSPGAARAVGLANGRNPISIVVPCHRVIGADGSLTGYGGGMARKKLLLELEARVARHPDALF